MYEGSDMTTVKMLEPSKIDYELLVLEIYRGILNATYEDNAERFEPFEEKVKIAPHRAYFVKIYRQE